MLRYRELVESRAFRFRRLLPELRLQYLDEPHGARRDALGYIILNGDGPSARRPLWPPADSLDCLCRAWMVIRQETPRS